MKIYLAIPYSFNPELSFKIACHVSAGLMEAGHVVFSPISHSHPIGKYLDPIYNTHDFWMEQDLPFVEQSDELHVVVIGEMGNDLIERSKGVQAELEHARKHKKPIKIIEYYE